MSEEAEIKIKLVADDHASAATKHVGTGIRALDAEVHHFKASLDHAIGYVGGQMIIEAFKKPFEMASEGVKMFTETLHEAFDAALETKGEIKEVKSALIMMSGGSASMKQIGNVAVIMHEELEESAIAIGVSTDAMREAFTAIAERSEKPVEAVQKLTEQMALAGKAFPGGMGALASGFAQMEMGVVRARNPVVQMIASTNLLQGNAKQVAAQMQKMSPEEQMKLGEKAIESMASKMKGAPLGFNAIIQSLKDMRKNIMETMGGPILDNITKVANHIRTFFLAHQDEIAEVAERIGNVVGGFISKSEKFFTDFVGVFAGKETDIGDSLSSAWDYARDAMTDILENGRALAQALNDTWAMAKSVFVGVSDAIAGIPAALGIVPMGDAKAKQAARLSGSELDPATEKWLKQMNAAAKDVTVTDEKLHKLQAQFREVAAASGMGAVAIDDYVAGMERLRDEVESPELKAATAAMETGVSDSATEAAIDDMGINAERFAIAYEKAAMKNDTATQKAIASLLQGSDEMQEAILNSGIGISDKMSGVAKFLKGAAKGEFAKLDKEALKGAGGGNVHMSGGQTFNIKQDFRDQDPDRIALVFRSDIMKASLSRIGAKTNSPFGL